MKKGLIIITLNLLGLFTLLLAQTPNSGPGLGIDSLNTTFIPANALLNQDIIVVNGVESINIMNVNSPTYLYIYDMTGKEVYKSRIEHKTRIDKQQFERGFYMLRMRSAEREIVKKLYL